MPLKKSANQILTETLSEPPCLKGGEGKRTGVAEVMSDSSSLELDASALKAYLNTEVRLQ